jgi:hypothetical protein
MARRTNEPDAWPLCLHAVSDYKGVGSVEHDRT